MGCENIPLLFVYNHVLSVPVLSDFNKRKIAKPYQIRLCDLFSCGDTTRTCDLQVMSLASYQLLHSAMLFLNCGCKGTHLFSNKQIFPMFFAVFVFLYH